MTSFATIPSTDPGLELGASGRTLLQERLSLYGSVMAASDTLFTASFYFIWSKEPSVGPGAAWAMTWSPSVVGLWLTLVLLALIVSAKPLAVRVLRGLDLAAHFAVGLALAGIASSIPLPMFGMFEALLGLSALLATRAILLPSSARFTLGVSLLACAPCAVVVLGGAPYFGAGAVAAHTVRALFLGRCALVIALAGVASAVVYQLRRQVRRALRLGQYTLEERLGEGGMGVVYRASHAMLRRPTAVKLLLSVQQASLQRFEREAQLTANLTHPNSIVVHDYGRTAEGVLYYAMEYLDGIDLEQLVEMDGPQPPARVVHLLRQACGALAEAHAAGLIHRDVKPANVFLCQRASDPDFVKVLDFGLVKHLAAADTALTGSPNVVGTPHYMAPEAFHAPQDVGPASDLYALGALAYWLLTGQHVFAGATYVQIGAQHLYDAPEPPSARLGRALPSDLETIVLRCLAKTPADRFASAEALNQALEACRDLPPWRRAEALSWWQSRAARIAQRRAARARRSGSTGNFPLTVDASRRSTLLA